MYSPIEGGFGRLSLQSMSPQQLNTEDEKKQRVKLEKDIKTRKYTIRDIISSFDSDILPSEFGAEVYESINYEQGLRAPTEWTVPGSFLITILQHASHVEGLYQHIYSFQTPDQRAVLYWQKITRSLRSAFEQYGNIGVDMTLGIDVVAARFRRIEEDFIEDKAERARDGVLTSTSDNLQLAWSNVHKAFVDTLETICQDSTSLFHALIEDPPATAEPFMIRLLEQIQQDPTILRSIRSDLERILERLQMLLQAPQENRNCAEYIRRLSVILESTPVKTPTSSIGGPSMFRPIEPKPDKSDDDGPSTKPAAPTTSEPPTGTKRSAPQGTGRRGRPKRGKK